VTLPRLVQARPALRPVLAGLVLVLSASPALAYWEIIPQVDAGITYEDNPRYISDESVDAGSVLREDATGVFTELQLDLTYKTPATELNLHPRVRESNYLESNKDLNEDDRYLDVLAARSGELGYAAFRGRYQETGIRTNEFESATPENPDEPPTVTGASGRFSEDTQEIWSFQPSLNYQLSPRNVVGLSGLWTESVYDEDETIGVGVNNYVDYDYSSVELSMRHVLDPKNVFVVALNGGSFSTKDPESVLVNSTDSFGITAAYERTISETLTGSLTVGINRSSIDIETNAGGIPLASNEERNFIGSLEVRKRSERTTLNFSVGSQIAPRSDGTEVIQEQLRFYVDRRLGARLDGSLGVLYSIESAVGEAAPNVLTRQDRDYFTVDAGLSWRLTETLSVYGTYSYLSDTTDVITGNIHQTNNRLYLGVRYRGVGLRR
jgi:hypothetical protein